MTIKSTSALNSNVARGTYMFYLTKNPYQELFPTLLDVLEEIDYFLV